ncbi:MAG: hypothetical protein ACFB0C_21275 [Leptolyngbyaceae cyanobacterium]
MKLSGIFADQNLSEPHSSQVFQDFLRLWAKRYIQSSQGATIDVRQPIAKTLKDHLHAVSTEVWNRPEMLLARQLVRRQMYGRLADPVAITCATCDLYSKALESYAEGLPVDCLALQMAEQIGVMRAKFTAIDPRVLGFVNMQFHYMGQHLLALVRSPYQAELALYTTWQTSVRGK